jgi:hypothetical protein
LVLKSNRLSLRPFQTGDIDARTALLGDPLVVRHIRAGRPLDSRATEKWVQSSQTSFGTDGTGALAVVLSPTRVVIGY